ncbi:MAG: DeoR/GlpR family DNA-binding transcription regulator [Caldicoprobacterales bacterium]|jgi:DeoR/GlpR family transcriptional regulator of sugar metabolism|nr:DeoR/GlpR transcriptional regulator [Clostridiales bacterium]
MRKAGRNVFAIERRNNLLSILHDKKSITVQEAAAMFNVTEETIRRDLRAMEEQNLLIRTHGGAVLADDINMEVSLEVREGINIRGKDLIGRMAADLVKDGDTLFMDASTSSLYVAKHLKEKKALTVITNAMRILLELAPCEEIRLISSGGYLRKKSLSYVGKAAEIAISSYHADKVFFSCKGFSPKLGATDSHEQESSIRRLMIQHSEEAIFLCDHTKYDKVGYTTTAQIEDMDYFITDKELPDGWEDPILNKQVRLIYPDSIKGKD